MNTTMPTPDNSSTNDIVLDESSNENTTSLNPISTSPPSFQEADQEATELATVIRRMHAADQRYWDESGEFSLLRNEGALHKLFQDNKSTTQRKLVDHFQVEGDAEGWEGESPCFQESKADDEERRIAIVDSEVDHRATVEKWRGAISNGLREHNQTTPQALDVQIIEDRIDKARSDLSFLEQQTRQIEMDMKTLQTELAKLKDQLCRTQIQFDE